MFYKMSILQTLVSVHRMLLLYCTDLHISPPLLSVSILITSLLCDCVMTEQTFVIEYDIVRGSLLVLSPSRPVIIISV